MKFSLKRYIYIADFWHTFLNIGLASNLNKISEDCWRSEQDFSRLLNQRSMESVFVASFSAIRFVVRCRAAVWPKISLASGSGPVVVVVFVFRNLPLAANQKTIFFRVVFNHGNWNLQLYEYPCVYNRCHFKRCAASTFYLEADQSSSNNILSTRRLETENRSVDV